MAATSLIQKLTNIGDAIREKTGESGTLTLDAMAAAIEALETGGADSFTFTPAETGLLSFTVENLKSPMIVLWARTDSPNNLSGSSTTDYAYCEGVGGVTFARTQSSQTASVVYGANSSYFSLSAKSSNVAINNASTSKTDYYGAPVINTKSADNLSFYVSEAGGKGLRAGATYTVYLAHYSEV